MREPLANSLSPAPQEVICVNLQMTRDVNCPDPTICLCLEVSQATEERSCWGVTAMQSVDLSHCHHIV